NEEEIKAALSTATGNNDKTRIEVLTFTPKKTADAIHATVEKVCNTSVTKAAIEELDASAELRKWVEQGVTLHEGKSTCAFCTSKIANDRLALLNQYYNDAYKTLMDGISVEQNNIKALIEEIRAIKL